MENDGRVIPIRRMVMILAYFLVIETIIMMNGARKTDSIIGIKFCSLCKI